MSRDDAERLDLRIVHLESDQTLQDLVLSVHHAVRHTFNGTGTHKLIENHLGRAYLEMHAVQVVQQQQPPRPAPTAPAQPVNPLGIPAGQGHQPPQNRAQRRKSR